MFMKLTKNNINWWSYNIKDRPYYLCSPSLFGLLFMIIKHYKIKLRKKKKKPTRKQINNLIKLIKKAHTIQSVCCNSKVKAEGKITKYYVCTKCNKACDIK